MRRGRGSLALLTTALGPFVALLIVMAFFAVAIWFTGRGTFFTPDIMRAVLMKACIVGVGALGMTVIVISGGIDLSVGSAVALAATVLAWGIDSDVAMLATTGSSFKSASVHLAYAQARAASAQAEERGRWQVEVEQYRSLLSAIAQRKLAAAEAAAEAADGTDNERPLLADVGRLKDKLAQLADTGTDIRIDNQWYLGVRNHWATATLAILLCIGTGVVAGLINGALVSMLNVVPFIITLGTMTLYLGLAKLMPDAPIRPEIAEIPLWVRRLMSLQPDPAWTMVSSGVWATLLFAGVLAFVLRRTVFGRHVFGIGSNETAARLCGINVSRMKMAVYALSGLFVGVAGIYNFSQLSQGDPTSGTGLELRIIAAVVIGGASLNGGRGTVLGALAGAALMATITSGCTQLGLPNPIQDVIVGLIIIAAVKVDQIRQRRS